MLETGLLLSHCRSTAADVSFIHVALVAGRSERPLPPLEQAPSLSGKPGCFVMFRDVELFSSCEPCRSKFQRYGKVNAPRAPHP